MFNCWCCDDLISLVQMKLSRALSGWNDNLLATAESHHQQEVIVIVIVDEQFIPALAVQNIPLKFTVLEF